MIIRAGISLDDIKNKHPNICERLEIIIDDKLNYYSRLKYDKI